MLPKHERFCEEYLLDLNGTQAYLRAGYKVSVETASKNSFKLLQKPEIQNRIQQLMKERSERTAITAERVLRELARIAFSDISQVIEVGADGGLRVKDISQLDENITAAISEVSEIHSIKTSKVSVKLHNKLGALQSLMQYLGMDFDFNQSIQGLRKYGLELWRDDEGRWNVLDLSRAD